MLRLSDTNFPKKRQFPRYGPLSLDSEEDKPSENLDGEGLPPIKLPYAKLQRY